MFSRLLWAGALALGLGFTGTAGAQTQSFPTRPVTIIIPFAPGGGTDVVARAMAPAFGTKLGGTIVLENISGAAGNIAATRVARAEPDGYTLIMHNLAFALNPGLYAKLPYDTEKDFVPIAMINYTPNVYVARKDFPPNNVTELVAYMKKNRTRLAHPGVGSTGHIQVALLAKAVGAEADFIPYRGGGPMLQDIVAGHVDMGTVTLGNAVEPTKGGQVKALGLTASKPSPLLPGVPGIAKDLGPTLDILFWNVLMAPAGTPQAVIDKIYNAFEETIKDQALVASWAKMGIDLYPREQRNPQAARELVRNEVARWRKIIHENKIETAQP
ncbi:MAG: tripartite tricarboxylate transporter substrate binding protein [Rhizobiales bacterium]|nr:tripartite tricarboxylate transporter substrate binding protein [Hyphomicrobiales bacterium]